MFEYVRAQRLSPTPENAASQAELIFKYDDCVFTNLGKPEFERAEIGLTRHIVGLTTKTHIAIRSLRRKAFPLKQGDTLTIHAGDDKTNIDACNNTKQMFNACPQSEYCFCFIECRAAYLIDGVGLRVANQFKVVGLDSASESASLKRQLLPLDMYVKEIVQQSSQSNGSLLSAILGFIRKGPSNPSSVHHAEWTSPAVGEAIGLLAWGMPSIMLDPDPSYSKNGGGLETGNQDSCTGYIFPPGFPEPLPPGSATYSKCRTNKQSPQPPKPP